jgi:hypothetical protein
MVLGRGRVEAKEMVQMKAYRKAHETPKDLCSSRRYYTLHKSYWSE